MKFEFQITGYIKKKIIKKWLQQKSFLLHIFLHKT